MKKYKLTIKRTVNFWNDYIIEADNAHQARDKLEQITFDGDYEFNYFTMDQNIIDEIILPEVTLMRDEIK